MPSLEPAEILAEINRIWQESPPDAIADLIGTYFTEDVVVVAPNLARVATGRAAVAASYGDFARSVRVLQAQIKEPQVDFFGTIAVATMPWKMQYEFDGRSATENGHDIYVFRRDDDRWAICWRCIFSMPGH